ncbi:hypothetical protein [Paraburkholderia sp. Ac-20347]|jgi:hypothetical protein|uniref:hypothetical protein n=1 Tax=Paraburkholderia sp. Ac-20347 TaxID=2703892 RepID=UPI00197F9026|nr:hypothetical protein [Paraburkholderia sp. Ac-20347]MBN3814767.1 hypothetical protein [Paraburkholderia sp. Ac-20347]
MGRNHRHFPPLTAAELADIYDRHPLPVVLRLLWEIHRLRSTISRANQVRMMIGTRVGTANTPAGIWERFEQELDAEPCLNDPLTPRQQGLLHEGESKGRLRRRRRNGD